MAEQAATLSSFQYKIPKVISWEFFINNDYDSSSDRGVSMPVQYTVSIEHKDGQNEATVILKLSIGEATQKTPFYLDAKIFVELKWDDKLINDVDKLLEENAVVLLLSYLRPMITQFTTYAGLMPFNLPFLDVRKFKK